MKRLIRRPWFAVTLVTASVLAVTSLSLCFGQTTDRRPGYGGGIRSKEGLPTDGAGNNHYPRVSFDDETREVIEAYRRTDDEAEKARIAKALPELVGKEFDARQKIREHELKQLEEQLRKLQELHQRRAKQRDQIVEERVRQLLRDADGLGWGSDEDRPADFSPKKVSLGGDRKAGPQFGL